MGFGRLRMIHSGRSCRTASYTVDPVTAENSFAVMRSASWLAEPSRGMCAACEHAARPTRDTTRTANLIGKKVAYIPRSRRGVMSPRSKIIAAAVLFSSGGRAIKFCSFGAWQLAAFRAALAMLTILVLLPEARRGGNSRTLVGGVAD